MTSLYPLVAQESDPVRLLVGQEGFSSGKRQVGIRAQKLDIYSIAGGGLAGAQGIIIDEHQEKNKALQAGDGFVPKASIERRQNHDGGHPRTPHFPRATRPTETR